MPRNTIQLALVYDAVRNLANHPTGEEVYADVRKKYAAISLGTVYRNLNKLAESGDILKISVPGAAERFDHNTHAHYHIKCMRCAAFSDVPLPYMAHIDELVADSTGYVLTPQDIVFTGVCKSCQALPAQQD